ncbi:HD domain-containing protein [Melissospora conviva]|uniref:HD domain-containing protein n=1 Tax=Melissospora conviva TaxID=3388432 RepID=UPI003C260EE7
MKAVPRPSPTRCASPYNCERRSRSLTHVRAVGVKAERLGRLVGDDAELLAAAGWLHDIGYAPDIADTGFHALDGADCCSDRASSHVWQAWSPITPAPLT